MKTDSDDGDGNLSIAFNNHSTETQEETPPDEVYKIYPDSVIENLWTSKVMGVYGPEEILVALWFYISHFFGLSSRIDHAKLCIGNIVLNKEGGKKRLTFNRDFQKATVFNTRFTSKPICEISHNKERCPIEIYEIYMSRRPLNFSHPTAPFYLQPDKSVQLDCEGPWFSAAGLGKNRIGSMFNLALTKCGQPLVRHYNSRRHLLLTDSPVTNSSDVKTPLSIPSPSTESKSPKIRLKISHLNSGNPIVTQSVSEELVFNENEVSHKVITRQTSTGCKKIKIHEKSKLNASLDLKIKSAKSVIRTPKKNCTLQKSIIMVASKELNPVMRQVMMQLGMMQDLLPTDYKARRSNSDPSGCDRNLRSGCPVHQMQLPHWPSIDKFCDLELQKSMNYSFDIEESAATTTITATDSGSE